MPTRRHGVARLARSATLAVVAAVALFCALLLAIRFVVYPRIESHEADIAAMMSREVGAPVEIDAISTGWDGWSPRLVVHGLRVRDAHDPSAAPVIELPSAAGVVSWTSLSLTTAT